MSRRRSRHVTKALSRPTGQPAITPAATFTLEQVTALMGAYTRPVTPINPLPRAPQVPFGPGTPLLPAPINPPRDDGTGRPEPRIYEYPVSVNLPGMSDRVTPWKVLRDAAEIPVIRDCIRIRKNQIATLEWDIVVTKRALQQYRKQDPDTSSVTIQKELRDRLDPDVGRLVEFWQNPDRQQGETFTEWAGKVLEEHLVLDAIAVYPYMDRARSQCRGLRVLDGSTIKVLVDGETGGRPTPPHPAYQQVLWGFPRGEYIADITDAGAVLNGYAADRLIYARREVRTFTPYGYSAVEQALQDVDLYLRRLEWLKAQYSEGTTPAGWIKNTGTGESSTWSPQQTADYTRAFNDFYSGQTLNRMRHHLLPPGLEPVATQDNAEKYKPEYDLHLIKLVAMHFDVTVAELGFTEAKGLGSSGYHEGQEDVQKRKGTNPTLTWLAAVITGVSRAHLAMPMELEFRFLGLDAEEEAAADDVIEKQVRSGRLTLNEGREEMGRAPYDFVEADKCMVEMSRGIVFLEGALDVTAPGQTIEPAAPAQEPLNVEGPAADDGTPDTPVPPTAATGPAVDGAQKTEVAAYRKWLRNAHTPGRPFVLSHLTPTQATEHGVDLNKVLFKAVAPVPKGAAGGRGGRWAWM